MVFRFSCIWSVFFAYACSLFILKFTYVHLCTDRNTHIWTHTTTHAVQHFTWLHLYLRHINMSVMRKRATVEMQLVFSSHLKVLRVWPWRLWWSWCQTLCQAGETTFPKRLVWIQWLLWTWFNLFCKHIKSTHRISVLSSPVVGELAWSWGMLN